MAQDKIRVKDTNWELFSERPNSLNYISEDGKWMLKTDGALLQNSKEDLLKEKELTDTIRALGLPTPIIKEVFQMDDGSWATIYEYVKDKKSITRLLSEDPEHRDEWIKHMAKLVKKLHETEANTDKLPNQKDRILSNLETLEYVNEEERKVLKDYILSIPDKTTCLHGDMQPGNYIHSPGGDFIIDIGAFSYGNPLFDLGNFYQFSHVDSNQGVQLVFRADKETARAYFDMFIKHYYEGESQEYIDARVQEIKDVAIVSMLSHGNVAFAHVSIQKALRQWLDERMNK